MYGASSSVGLFAVQIAKLVGYRVIGVCSPHNFDLVRSLGADEVVSYRDREVVERIHSITGSSIRSGLDTIAEGDSFRISVGAFGPEGGKLSVILGVPEAARRIRPDVNLEFLSMYTLFGKVSPGRVPKSYVERAEFHRNSTSPLAKTSLRRRSLRSRWTGRCTSKSASGRPVGSPSAG